MVMIGIEAFGTAVVFLSLALVLAFSGISLLHKWHSIANDAGSPIYWEVRIIIRVNLFCLLNKLS